MYVNAINNSLASHNTYRPLKANNPHLISILNPAAKDDASALFNIINPTPETADSNKPWWDLTNSDPVFKALFSFATTQQPDPGEETFFDPGYISIWLQHPNSRLSALANDITKGLYKNDDKATAIIRWVIANFPYETDEANYGVDELWAPPTFALQTGSGDCIANYEEIQTASGLKKVGDLQVNDVVLSYDLIGRRFCTLPISKIWEKGKLPVYRVTFRNGAWVDVTEDHPFWTRRVQKYSDYEKTKLCNIDLTRWWKRKVPCVKELPYVVRDIECMTEEICFLIGYFLAEGYVEGSHVRVGGYDIPEDIEPILEKYSVPYSMYYRPSDGLPIVNFLQSKFKDYLRTLKTSSFDIHIPEELFHLPKSKLKALIAGHLLGDGHYSAYTSEERPVSNKEKTYSTSSTKWAFALQRIALQIGKPLYMWLQEEHGGVGNKPIWRLSYNSKSAFSADHGYPGLSEVSIKSVEYIGEHETRDFEIPLTHTFINRFGILLHNCEDGAFLVHSLLLHAGIPYNRIRTYGGLVKAGEGAPLGGHGWTAYKRESDDEWVVLDTAYYPNMKHVDDRRLMKYDSRYVDNFFWFNKLNWTNTYDIDRIHNPEAPIYNAKGYMDKKVKLAGWLINEMA
jgi:hypothetical protein